MTTVTVTLGSMQDLAYGLHRLQSDWHSVAEDAMRGALIDGGYVRDVQNRVPKSERSRYIMTYKAVQAKVRTKGEEGKPETWRYSVSSKWADQMMKGVEGTRARDKRAASIERMRSYGQSRLQKSLIPVGRQDPFTVRREAHGVTLSISSSLPYAARMHEAAKPAEGDYWTPGKRGGWSTPRTGNRYLLKPYEDNQQRILREFGRNIDAILKGRGLL